MRIVGKDDDGNDIKEIVLDEIDINGDERLPLVIISEMEMIIRGTNDQIKTLIANMYHQFEGEWNDQKV